MPYTVVVDDDDPGIHYSDTWNKAQSLALKAVGVTDSIGSTLHYASGRTSPLLTYAFTGSTITVYAIMTPEVLNNASFPYNWRCYVDDIPTSPIIMPKLNVPGTIKICHEEHLKNEAHRLIFNFFDANNQILFDYLEFTPPASPVPRSYSYIGITLDSANITYSGDWFDTVDSDGVFARQTERPGDSAEVQFTGSSISLVGYTSLGKPGATASYSIDGGNSTTFSVPTYASNLSDILPAQGSGQLLFQIPSLDPTVQHRLHIKYKGEPNNTFPPPLGVTTIIIANGTIPASNATTPAQNVPASPSSHRYRTAIVGAISGFVVATIFISAFIYSRRRRSRLNIQQLPLAQPYEPAPAALPRNTPTGPDRKGQRRLPPATPPSNTLPSPEGGMHDTNMTTSVLTSDGGRENFGVIPNVQPLRRTTSHIQEEDSGIRMVGAGNEGEVGVIILPPVYTAT